MLANTAACTCGRIDAMASKVASSQDWRGATSTWSMPSAASSARWLSRSASPAWRSSPRSNREAEAEPGRAEGAGKAAKANGAVAAGDDFQRAFWSAERSPADQAQAHRAWPLAGARDRGRDGQAHRAGPGDVYGRRTRGGHPGAAHDPPQPHRVTRAGSPAR